MNLRLRKTQLEDFEVFFKNQQDEIANQMAGFTSKDPNDREAYMTKWTRLLPDETLTLKTILVDDQIVGTVFTYEMEGATQISYWIDRTYWGRGVATRALQLFLQAFQSRPVYGRIAFDNIGSQRVLEKCGFREHGREMYFANARGKEIEEIIFVLKE